MKKNILFTLFFWTFLSLFFWVAYWNSPADLWYETEYKIVNNKLVFIFTWIEPWFNNFKKVLTGADISSFQIFQNYTTSDLCHFTGCYNISPEYAMDNKKVYYMGEVISWANPSYFYPIDWKEFTLVNDLYFKDRSNIYYRWKMIEWVDVNTFTKIKFNFYNDKNSIYYEWRKINLCSWSNLKFSLIGYKFIVDNKCVYSTEWKTLNFIDAKTFLTWDYKTVWRLNWEKDALSKWYLVDQYWVYYVVETTFSGNEKMTYYFMPFADPKSFTTPPTWFIEFIQAQDKNFKFSDNNILSTKWNNSSNNTTMIITLKLAALKQRIDNLSPNSSKSIESTYNKFQSSLLKYDSKTRRKMIEQRLKLYKNYTSMSIEGDSKTSIKQAVFNKLATAYFITLLENYMWESLNKYYEN